jgi:hypothetical protein
MERKNPPKTMKFEQMQILNKTSWILVRCHGIIIYFLTNTGAKYDTHVPFNYIMLRHMCFLYKYFVNRHATISRYISHSLAKPISFYKIHPIYLVFSNSY